MKKYFTLLLIFSVSGLSSLRAQISFPNGNVLNLDTQIDLLYLETRVIFNTGIYKSDDYRWEKISDSLDKSWFVTACFNGDCRNDLLQSGNFIKDFGLNDTTCFIAFHVETKGYTGKSVIKYRIINIKDTSDNAIVIYNIAYTNVANILKIPPLSNEISVYPNPAIDKLVVKIGNMNPDFVFNVYKSTGELVKCQNLYRMNCIFDISNFPAGIYFYTFQNKEGRLVTGRIMKN